jgi:V-type H+-transporting ATPase subunit a
MKYIQIFIPRDQARDVVANLGKVGAVEFVDLNGDLSAFQRTFVDKIRKCDDVMKQLGVLFDHVERAKIEIPDYEPPVTTPVQRKSTEQLGDLQFSNVTIEELPEILAKVTENIDYLDSNYQNLAKQKGQLVEYKTVLELASKFLSVSEFAGQSVGEEKESPRVPEDEEPILMGSPVAQSSLLDDQHLDERIGGLHVEDGSRLIRRISGTINESKRIIMERMLFRASRGNVISRFIQVKDAIEDPSSGESAKKLVFILFFSGQRVREKINKILTTLNASVYSVPDSSADQQQLISDTTRNIDQQADVLEKTRRLRDRSLQEIVGDLGLWKFKVTKERAIYTEMNKFNPDMSRASLVAEGWVCDHMLSKVRETLSKTSSFGNDSPGPVMTVIHPPPPHAGIIPTHIETNEFTGPFQSIVDSYGKPNYREFNPGLFTIISFPFLFAIMFGDVGHGFLMVLGAAYLIYNEEKMKKQKNMSEMIRIVFGGRWVVLLMGLFSVYVGFIYNEVFSLPLPMWGQTQWTQITSHAGSARQLGVYPFGLDPAWASTSVALSYFNSLKMKMAIVFGVVQMVLGIFVGLSNFIYFRKKLDIYFTFIPQIIFSKL